MKLFAIVFLAFAVVANGEKIRYNGYKVHRITPHTQEHLDALLQLQNLGASYWREPTGVGKHADIMFPPHIQGDIFSGIQSSGMKVEKFVENVQELIDANEEKALNADDDFAQYKSLAEINAFLDAQVAKNSDIASIFSIGNSYEGRPLRVLKISRGGSSKPAIWLDANIHAREWITSAVAMFTINEILNGQYQSWSEDYDFYILTMFNPDGFQYTKTSDRLWRKTRSPGPNGSSCKGADANRNFDFHWLDGGSSTNPCSETYAGKSAFSEVEALTVGKYVGTIPNLVAYISLHSYSQYILLPYGHSDEHIPQYTQYMTIGRNVATATAKRYGTKFTPGNIVDLLYVASGGSMDYVKGTYNTNLTLTYEMRDEGRYGFLLPANQIRPSGEEFLDGFQVIIDALNTGVTTPPLVAASDAAPSKPQRAQRVHTLLNRGADAHTFGSVPHPRRGASPLRSFQH